jgi:Ca-activated chloride channel family protein
MTFDKLSYLPIVLVFLGAYYYFYSKNLKAFYFWVKDHWFFQVTDRRKISDFLFLSSLGLMLFALLDLRGLPEKITSTIPEQKTVIMIDSSTSMLAEDVRPNRFKKALFLARHFVKKAIGHQVSVLVFSDQTKKLVPFTTDVDLLDSRIDGLASLNINRGGTNLSTSIAEAKQYLRTSEGSYSGNILIYTDAEETEGGVKIDLGSDISVAAIGVGTSKGSTIPLRDRVGSFRGNKRFERKDVISKLDEKFLAKLGDNIKNYKYWVASSYSLPTDEVLEYFSSIHKAKYSEGEVTVQKIYLENIMIPAMLLFIASMLLRFGKNFIYVCLIFSFNINAQEEEKESPFQPQIDQYLNYMKKGELHEDEKQKLAEYYLRSGKAPEATQIYKESLAKNLSMENEVEYLNYGTSLAQEGNLEEAMDVFAKLNKNLKGRNDEQAQKLKQAIKNNTLMAFKQQEQQKKQKQKEGEDKDQKEKGKTKDKQKGQGKGSEEKKKNDKEQDGKQGEDKDSKEKKDQEGKDKKDDKGKGDKEKEKKDGKGEQGEKKDEKQSQKGKESRKEFPKVSFQLC